MGQYHMVFNWDKKEYIDPHNIGLGMKQAEQIGDLHASMGDLLYLLLCISNDRGGGDVPSDGIEDILGRWAGDRIMVVGDYSEPYDLTDRAINISNLTDPYKQLYSDETRGDEWTEISGLVSKIMRKVWGIELSGTEWLRRKIVDKSAYLMY